MHIICKFIKKGGIEGLKLRCNQTCQSKLKQSFLFEIIELV